MSHHPATSRPKPRPAGNEEASTTINLGEFQEVDTLTLSEAALVISALVTKRRTEHKDVNENEYACPLPAFQSRMGDGGRRGVELDMRRRARQYRQGCRAEKHDT